MMISPPLLTASLSVTIVSLAVVALLLLWWLSQNTQRSLKPPQEETSKDQQAHAQINAEALDEVESALKATGLAILRELPLIDKRGKEPVTRVAPLVTVFGDALWLLSVVCVEGSDGETNRETNKQLQGALHDDQWTLIGAEGEALGVIESPLKESLATLEVIKVIAHAQRLREVTLRCGVVCLGATPQLSGQHKQARVMSLPSLQRLLKPKNPSQRSSRRKTKRAPHSDLLEQERALWRHLRQRVHSSREAREENT
jgi:hypothetical protein